MVFLDHPAIQALGQLVFLNALLYIMFLGAVRTSLLTSTIFRNVPISQAPKPSYHRVIVLDPAGLPSHEQPITSSQNITDSSRTLDNPV